MCYATIVTMVTSCLPWSQTCGVRCTLQRIIKSIVYTGLHSRLFWHQTECEDVGNRIWFISTLHFHCELADLILNPNIMSKYLLEPSRSRQVPADSRHVSGVHPLMGGWTADNECQLTFHVDTLGTVLNLALPRLLLLYELNTTPHNADEWLSYSLPPCSGLSKLLPAHSSSPSHMLFLPDQSLLFFCLFINAGTITVLFKVHFTHLCCRDILKD